MAHQEFGGIVAADLKTPPAEGGPGAADDPPPVPQKRLTIDMLKRALAVLKQPREGGTEAGPQPDPLMALIDPGKVDPVDHDELETYVYAVVSRPPSVFELIKQQEEPANPIAYDPSGKDWQGIKAAAAREASEDYLALLGHVPMPYFGDAVPTTQERIAPRGILTMWTDKTSRPSLWEREP